MIAESLYDLDEKEILMKKLFSVYLECNTKRYEQTLVLECYI